ncbi:hypothetical protein BSL78_17769 [Apostichopus japonicus]|uniref:Uncharacterized protein n=1 Tax=Stichopus japonicus TaxID=307972 RepID=A0A2G8KBF8_STIJA|nr:hypothetical protein BSL78_17769 [Apostichopus japonicus]
MKRGNFSYDSVESGLRLQKEISWKMKIHLGSDSSSSARARNIGKALGIVRSTKQGRESPQPPCCVAGDVSPRVSGKSTDKEVATEADYEQEDSDQDDSIEQPVDDRDIKKGHSLNDAQQTGIH